MKMRLLPVVFVATAIVFGFAHGCSPKRYTVVKSGNWDVQSVVAKVNQGIGEGHYEDVIVFHGKDPSLVSSCTVPANEWERISSMGEPRGGEPFAVREGIFEKHKTLHPLGGWCLNGVDYYGFASTNGEVYLVVVNFGDAGGKFPDEFWKVIMRNIK